MKDYLVTAILILSALVLSLTSAADTGNGSGFGVLETPKMLHDQNRIVSWYVRTSPPAGYKSLSHSENPTLVQHHNFSVLAHAKAVSADKIALLRYSVGENYSEQFGLVADRFSRITEAEDYEKRIAILPEVAEVRYEPSAKAAVTVQPNDQCYYNQKELGISSPTGYQSTVDMPDAWGIEQGDPELEIAVLDTGIVSHEDLDQSRMMMGSEIQDFISSPVQAADGNGRDRNPTDPGWSNDCQKSSDYHGTHVTGTLAATGDNARGIAGINWKSQIIPTRVLGPQEGSSGDIVDAVNWLAGKSKVKVLNLSLGIRNYSCSNAFGSSSGFLSQAAERNKLSVVAAGNDYTDAGDFSPANCEGALSVAAANRNGKKSHYSNFGPGVDISAPGGELGRYGNNSFGILSTVNQNHYDYRQGTSMATPIVSGIASLVFSANDQLDAPEVKNILLATARPFPNYTGHGVACDTEICGAGIVNAEAAVRHASASNPPLLFFPKQELHAVSGQVASVEVLLSKKLSSAITFTIDTTSDSCVVSTIQYRVTIPSDTLGSTVAIGTNSCQYLKLSLATPSTSASYRTNDKNSIKVAYLGSPDGGESEMEFEKVHWAYLNPSSDGNVHRVTMPVEVQESTYYLGVASEMNTEIRVSDAATEEVLYDSMEEDSLDEIKTDYSLKYTANSTQTLKIRIRERSSTGQGGLYAVSLTRAPSLRSESAVYCRVPTGTPESDCSPSSIQNLPSDKIASQAGEEGSSSVGIYLLLALFFLLLLSSAPARQEKLIRTLNR